MDEATLLSNISNMTGWQCKYVIGYIYSRAVRRGQSISHEDFTKAYNESIKIFPSTVETDYP